MKTDVYRFERAVSELDSINELAEKAAAYSGLDEKQKLRLMLLCEELIEMLPNLLIYGKGEFWIETDGKKFAIHSAVEADDLLTSLDREDILKVSTTGKNAAATGIMNKIRVAAEIMLSNCARSAGTSPTMGLDITDPMYAYYSMGMYRDPVAGIDEWSLSAYRDNVKKGDSEWDELERSIIAKLADEVTVGILGGRVEIVIRKEF